jgi:alpha-L-fucosidase
LRNYPDMVCLWYDVPRFLRPVQSYEFYRIAFDIQPAMIINSRVGNDFGDYYITGDNLIPEDPESIGMPWETVGTINNTWAYSSYDRDWKSVKELLFWLIEIASKGGNYMLNIGPGGDGTVPEESAERLRAMGDWLKMNGESIYGTQAWICSHEGPTTIHMAGTVRRRKEGFHAEITPDDIWFTAKGNTVYAIGLEEPPNGRLLIRSFAGKKVISVGMLGHDDKVPWQLNDSGLILELPQKSDNSIGYVLKVILET